jgi:hypothetical protein
MSHIDTAIARLQDIILSSSDTTIKNAPDYPVSDAGVLPIVIAHVGNGEAQAVDGTYTRFISTIQVDVHFPRISLKETYRAIDAITVEFPRRLHGDPTLGGAVETIVFPVTWESPAPMRWDGVVTHMVRFNVRVKTFETPIT